MKQPPRYHIDDHGEKVTEGDTIHFSFGIPPIGVNAPVVRINGWLYALTPGCNPKKCRLSKLRGYVGYWSKINE